MKRTLLIATPLIIIAVSALLFSNFLSPALPEPTGPHAIGYQRLVIENSKSWVDVQAFYPAKEALGSQPQAMPADLAEQMSKSLGVPAAAMFDERALPAYTDAPVINEKLPVLIFNHGHGMFATQNSHNILELASHGYVVLTLSHPGHSLISKNGDLTVLKEAHIASYEEDEIQILLERQRLGNQQLRTSANLVEWKKTMTSIQDEAFADIVDQFSVWIANNQLVLDALPQLASGEIHSALKHALDLDKIGYFGHSFGGAVATHMNMNEAPVKASFNLDGPVFTWSLVDNPQGQFCFAYGDTNNQAGVKTDYSWVNQQIAITTGGCEQTFEGAAHMNFSDLNEITILKWFGQLGPVDGATMRKNLNQSLVSFFNQHLLQKGESTNLVGTQLIQH